MIYENYYYNTYTPLRIEPPLDPPCDYKIVYCPKCDEEAEFNNNNQIECYSCEECFDIPEPDYDYDYEERRYA